MSIQVAIIDDDQQLGKTLKRELEDYPDIAEIKVYTSGLGFVHHLRYENKQPDVVLMDISMSLADEGIQATRLLNDQFPNIKVVMFTMSDDDENVFEAFKSGSVGYLLKNEKPSFIYKTIVDVSQGGALMSPGIAIKTIKFLHQPVTAASKKEEYNLSDREVEILRMVAKGHTYHSMASLLFISHETVKKHISNIFRKLHVRNKIEAINKTKEWL